MDETDDVLQIYLILAGLADIALRKDSVRLHPHRFHSRLLAIVHEFLYYGSLKLGGSL